MSIASLQLVHIPFPVSYPTLVKSAIRSIMVQLFYDNAFLWDYTLGRRNSQADVEGPFYVIGSPNKEVEKGRAVMAPLTLLQKFHPFLMIVRVVSPEGNPVAGAELDWWQADTTGSYYFRTYTLRGRIKTDEQGYAEVLTVTPGVYGPAAARRAAHFHLWIHAPPAQPGRVHYDDLTTQIYVCDANNPGLMKSDFVNYLREIRLGNMAQCWSLPDKDVDEGRPYKLFPELPSSDVRSKQRIEWWNLKLAQMDDSLTGLKIVAGATAVLHLNPKGGRF